MGVLHDVYRVATSYFPDQCALVLHARFVVESSVFQNPQRLTAESLLGLLCSVPEVRLELFRPLEEDHWILDRYCRWTATWASLETCSSPCGCGSVVVVGEAVVREVEVA